MNPKKIILPSLAVLLLTSHFSHSAVILDSGGDGTTTSNINSGASGGAGKAVGFTLGTSTALGPGAAGGYLLESIDVRLVNNFGGAIAASAYTFTLYSNDANTSPDALLATFNSVSLASGALDFVNLTLTTPYLLNPETSYWIVATSTITNSQLGWRGTGSDVVTSAGISSTNPAARFGTGVPDPANWASSSALVNDIRINASPVPEPVSTTVVVAGLAVLGLRRRRI